jgi:hypothetical protein
MDRMAWSPLPRDRERHDRFLASLMASDRAVLADDGQFIVWGPERDAVSP